MPVVVHTRVMVQTVSSGQGVDMPVVLATGAVFGQGCCLPVVFTTGAHRCISSCVPLLVGLFWVEEGEAAFVVVFGSGMFHTGFAGIDAPRAVFP